MARAELTLGAALLALAACLPRTSPQPDPAFRATVVYSCPGDYRFSARMMSGIVSLRLPTRTAALPQVRASSGMRYEAEGVEFWNRGETASLRLGSERHEGCGALPAGSPWEEARLLGADFRAVGREPAWNLELDGNRHMRFLIEGSSEILTPLTEPVRAGSSVTYRAATETNALEVTIEERPCTDPLIAESLTHTVRLTLNGFPFVGCGRMLGGVPPVD